MKVGVIGDIHFPFRSKEVPAMFIEWFRQEKVDIVIGTGDYNDPKILEILEQVAKRSYFVKGNTDFLDLPKDLELEIEGLKIYVFHSDNIYPRGDISKIYRVGKEKNADVVIFGHTHLPFFTYIDGIYFLNPGSAGGVVSGEGVIPPKSAAILELGKEIRVKFKLLP